MTAGVPKTAQGKAVRIGAPVLILYHVADLASIGRLTTTIWIKETVVYIMDYLLLQVYAMQDIIKKNNILNQTLDKH